MQNHELLIEIGTEELPSKSLKKLMLSLREGIQTELQAANLKFETIHSYATPRRLAIYIQDLADIQPERRENRKGPAVKAAFNEKGEPTPACLGFAKSVNAEVKDLKEKEGYLYYEQVLAGAKTETIIPSILAKVIARLPIPKPMRWGKHSAEFIRPVHWLVALYGNKVIDCELLGLKAGDITYGHRFHHPEAIRLKNASEYEKILEKAMVIADFAKRKAKIKTMIEKTAAACNAQAIIPEDLLDEVTGLVEWPVIIKADFDPRFLKVPKESLITAMQHHQKSFALLDAQHHLQPHFISISNIESKIPEQVKAGNEKVMRARLADAEFFYNTDLKTPLSTYMTELQNVVFQKELGTTHDKAQRITDLSAYIASSLKIEPEETKRAACLAKADLMSNMVKEFPELQGIMGSYYAAHQQEPAKVCLAIQEHYLPRFAGDKLPSSLEGAIVALADRIDTLVGIFGINQAPTGEKDPFALRRAALGVLRIIIEKQLVLDLMPIIRESITLYGQKLKNPKVYEEVLAFILERLKAWSNEKGISADVYAAVSAKQLTAPTDIEHRLRAVTAFKQLPEASALAAANKRVSKLLQKELQLAGDINPKLLNEPAEKELATQLAHIQKVLEPLLKARRYESVLTELASLRPVVDQFFDQVMVMVDDTQLRDNRLKLLTQLRALFLEVADISLLQ